MTQYSGMWTNRQQLQATGTPNWPNKPGAPTIGTATAGAGSASVAFTAPSYTGYPATITGYTATSSPGGFTGTGASSPITVSGLTNGTAYTFTVTATNATGTGPASAASNSVTPAVNYIEDVFSTYLYTGNGSTQTITNGIDLAGNGGMVWLKARTAGGSSYTNHAIIDTARGANANGYYSLYPNLTEAQFSPTGSSDAVATAVSSTGFTVGGNPNVNYNTQTDVSWTFRKQPKFFTCGTYTGTGSVRTIAHDLGSTPGVIIVKQTSASGRGWITYHRSLGATKYLDLSQTNAEDTWSIVWNNTAPTSTEFTVGTFAGVNESGQSYVYYAFAHDAGGFGLTGTDNVISCGSFTMPSSGDATITLGYEPQWVMAKTSSTTGGWFMADVMRGWSNTSDAYVYANTSGAEVTNTPNYWNPTATGFTAKAGCFPANSTVIYIAIRRGPMATPTDATKVFNPVYGTTSSPIYSSSNFTSGIDTSLGYYTPGYNDGTNAYPNFQTRLTGTGQLQTSNYRAEVAISSNTWAYMNGYATGSLGSSWGAQLFKRAPGFHDVVCSVGTTSSNNARTHNLGVVPEMIIVKDRSSGAAYWTVYVSSLGQSKYLTVNTTDAAYTNSNMWGTSAYTSTTFYCADTANWCASAGDNGIFYLFATLAGVSKVGSYTGNGALTTIDCGFTGGARFVLIKRTDASSNWFMWDTNRGMVAGTDPSISINTYNAQSNANSVYTIATGFQLLASPAVDVNTNGGTYIYLAVA